MEQLMPSKLKTWREKYATRTEPEVQILSVPFAGMKPGQKMLISTPAEIEAYVRSVRPGETVEVQAMRAELAHRHQAEVTCPTTTSIFLRIVSEIALEDLAEGKATEAVTPFWRVVDPKSPLAKKLTCGPEWIQARREAESA